MNGSLALWIAAAIALFWAVGAYNRLMRLRAAAHSAFVALETELARQAALVDACALPEDALPASQFDGGSAFWGSLQGSAAQLTTALAAARLRPLEPDRIAALGAAQEMLAAAWERAERDDAHDLAGPRLPENITAEREQLERQVQAATRRFNEAVAGYNEAIAQFPATVLAWLFGFKPGRGLRGGGPA